MRGPGLSLGTLIFLYAINLGRNQVTDDSAEHTNCFATRPRSRISAMPEFITVATVEKFLRGPDGPSKSKGSGLPCLMSTGPSTPSTTPVRMREDRSEKAIWMATSSNVRGMDRSEERRVGKECRSRWS